MSSAVTRPEPRIFIAEDNPGDVYLVEVALREHGVDGDLLVVGHGDRAMELLEEMSDTECPDLILMDLNLPGKGGIDVLTELRNRLRCEHVPVVIMTSSSATSDRQAAERLGVSHYFRKPTHLEAFLELGAIVKRLLRR